ncbi:BamA/TamA family outer membrane protein [Belliella kenyensis]|uniref:BamA/TamA family outer membrane protein n=1 Tax=Belliella kenyensis TaxID=1472724 RepID=A0ABV8EJD9_9BACT|nr:BamA/TamA family outer membrane protein [Belliella kenyensis]MCH7403671.1 BamA/TamA family outer membrane protein [Belliella kenyensis]MDN3603438.1 BamA/TamA family outer membrane protein [Belliella kenyensis]
MKKILSIVFLISVCQLGYGQSFVKRYLNKVLNDTSEISQPQFLVYPTLAYTPETSWEIGFSTLYVYYTKRDTTNRLSEINGFTFATLENQYGLLLDHAIYTDKNNWFFLGNIRAQSFPLKYYGIGMGTSPDYLALVDANQVLIKERVLRKLAKNLFAGVEFDFQKLAAVDFKTTANAPNYELPLGSGGSTNFGIGAGIVYDNRHNVLNVRDGFFSELAYLRYSPAVSSFGFNTIISDTRIFRPVGQHNVFAAQLLAQFNTGDVPFNQLALLGGESMMRGYYLGRFRDKNQIASQVEMRFLPLPLGFSNRIGAAVFGGLGTVFPDFTNLSLNHIVWSAGGGLRFLLFPKKDIYTRIDYALTAEGSGFYLFIGEAF